MSRITFGLAILATFAGCGAASELSEQANAVADYDESLDDAQAASGDTAEADAQPAVAEAVTDDPIAEFADTFVDTSLAIRIEEYGIMPDSAAGTCLAQYQGQQVFAVTFVIAECDPALVAGDFFEAGGGPVIAGITEEQQECAALEMVKFLTGSVDPNKAKQYVDEHWVPRARVEELAAIVEPACGITAAQLTELNEYQIEEWYG